MKATDTRNARILGNIAFAKGIKSAPVLDVDFMATLKGCSLDEGIAAMKAWIAGWHEANLACQFGATSTVAS